MGNSASVKERDGAIRVFTITCKVCKERIADTDRIRDPEIARLQAHAGVCGRLDPGDASSLGDLLRLFVVTASEEEKP